MEAVLFASLIWQVTDWLKEVLHFTTNKSAVLTQAVAWVAGIVLIALAAHASVTQGITFPGLNVTLGDLDGASIVLVGLLASSLASSLVDAKQALDNSDTSGKPPLVGP